MYSYAIVLVEIFTVVSLGYSEAYVNCYQCSSKDNPSSSTAKYDCIGPDMTNVPTCVGATCVLSFDTCSGTDQQCQDFFIFPIGPNQKTSVDRGCTNDTIDSDNCSALKFTIVTAYECVCKGDLCNAGPTLKAFPKITFGLLIMLLCGVTHLRQWEGWWSGGIARWHRIIWYCAGNSVLKAIDNFSRVALFVCT